MCALLFMLRGNVESTERSVVKWEAEVKYLSLAIVSQSVLTISGNISPNAC